MIVNRSVFGSISVGNEGMTFDSNGSDVITPEEQVQAEIVENNANIIDTDIQALEDMENIADAMEKQVLQNEVNLASIQSEEVPAQGENISVTEKVDSVNDVGDIVEDEEVIAEGQAPVATLTPESSISDIQKETDDVRQGLESMSVLMSNTGAFKEGGLMSVRNNSVNRRNVVEVGIESIVNSPINAYKQACLNYSVGLCSVKETISNFFKMLMEKIVEFFKQLSPFENMCIARARKVAEGFRVVDLNSATIKSTGNGTFLTYFLSTTIEDFEDFLQNFSSAINGLRNLESIKDEDTSRHNKNLDFIRGVMENMNNAFLNSYPSKLYKTLVKCRVVESTNDDSNVLGAIPLSPTTVAIVTKKIEDSKYNYQLGYEINKVVLADDISLTAAFGHEEKTKEVVREVMKASQYIAVSPKRLFDSIRKIEKSLVDSAKTYEAIHRDTKNAYTESNSKTVENIYRFGARLMVMSTKTISTVVKSSEIALSWIDSGNKR